MNQTLRIEMLGGLAVTSLGETFTRFRSQTAGSLLAYLAYFLNRPHHRELLADLFWPDSDPERGRLNLRVTLNSLRRVLEGPTFPAGSILMSDRLSIQLNPAVVTTDVQEFQAAVRDLRDCRHSGDSLLKLRQVISIYRGPLLPGDSHEWSIRERERLAHTQYEAMEELRDRLIQLGEWREALEYARLCAEAQPYEDAANEVLIRTLVAAGRTGEAKRSCSQFKLRLRSELGLEPSEVLKKLFKTVSEGEQTSIGRATPQGREEAREKGSNGVQERGKAAPPARSYGQVPLRLTRLVGREQELAELSGLLTNFEEPSPLVTLTGPGGCGKTRLLVEAAHRVGSSFPGGVWFVDLSGVFEVSQLAGSISAALGLHDGQLNPAERIAQVLNRGNALLALDNMEQLLPEKSTDSWLGGDLILQLLQLAPQTTCVVTSRRRLGLEGEVELRLQPLRVPSARASMQELVSTPSVDLFVGRARLVHPHFAITQGNAADMREACRLLEGLPLAIELAAAWSHTLSVKQIADRLRTREPILVSRRRGGPERHRSLQAALAWSFELLSSPLSNFIQALSVFRGGWTVDAAAQVLENANSADLLAELQERSLLNAFDWQGSKRFRMMESVREFASESIDEQRQRELAERHASYFESFAQEAADQFPTAEQATWLRRVESEEDNLQAALTWCLGEHPLRAARLVCGIAAYWELGGRDSEIRIWFNRIAVSRLEHPEVKASCLLALARLDLRDNRIADAQLLVDDALKLARGNYALETTAICLLAYLAMQTGDLSRGRVAYEQVLALFEERKELSNVSDTLLHLGELEARAGKTSLATQHLQRGLSISDKVGYLRSGAELAVNLGEVALDRGELREAGRFTHDALKRSIELGDKILQARCFLNLGQLAASDGNIRDAQRYMNRGLRMFARIPLRKEAAVCQVSLADLARAQGQEDQAYQLYRTTLDDLKDSPRLFVLANLGLAKLALSRSKVSEAIATTQGCFAYFGQIHFRDRLNLVETAAACMLATDHCEIANQIVGEVEVIRRITGLSAKPSDRVVCPRSKKLSSDAGELLGDMALSRARGLLSSIL